MSTNKHTYVNRTVTPDGEIAEFGPFTWKRCKDGSREESWDLTHINGVDRNKIQFVGLTYFCVKNYGGKPGDGFKGWKLVSGGPFNSAGAYDTVNEAIAGVTPYMIEYYTRLAADKMTEAKSILKLLAGFQPKLTLAMPAGAGKTGWGPCG